MNTLQYLKLRIALVLTVKLWLNQELNLGLQTTSLMPRKLGHLTKLFLRWRYFQQYKSPFEGDTDTFCDPASVSVLTGFGWSIVFIIWEQEKNTTKEMSGKVVQPALVPSTLTEIS